MAHDLVVSRARLIDGRSVDIGVSGAKIEAIDGAGKLKGSRTIDANNGLCVRPLSDSHLHLDKAGTVGPGNKPPASIGEAIAAMRLVKQAAQRDPAAVQERMITTLRRLRRNGTRYLRALVDVDDTWGLTGFRAALAARRAVPELTIKVVAFAQEGMSSKVGQLLSEAASTGADGIGAHTDVDTDPKNHIRTAVRIAREADLPLEVHVDEPASAESFKLPMVLEEASGLSGLTLVHCLSLARLPEPDQDRWIEQIKRSGASVVVATSVLLFGLPLAPIRKMLESGVPVGLGSDNLQDVFVPMGTGRILETARTTGIVAGLGNYELQCALLQGATGVGYRLVSGEDERLVPGASATFSVFAGATASAVMFGEDAVQLTVIDGKPEEKVTL